MISNVHFLSLISSSFVGLIGLLPLIVFYSGFRKLQLRLEEPVVVSRLLSFAVGCLLGDIFFHLMPESWSDYDKYSMGMDKSHHVTNLLLTSREGPGAWRPESWVLGGFLTFYVFEKLFTSFLTDGTGNTRNHDGSHVIPNNWVEPSGCGLVGKIRTLCANYFRTLTVNDLKLDDNKEVYYLPASPIIPCMYTSVVSSSTAKEREVNRQNCPNFREQIKDSEELMKPQTIITHSNQTTGYMNLVANFMDNFTHGLAISASYSSRTKMGFLTTCAIFLHEIPHEFGDFAILLKSGFNTWSAIKAQLFTSVGCVLGAAFGMLPFLSAGVFGGGGSTYRILSFTSGGFIHIVLVKIIPDLINQKDLPLRETFYHVCGVGIGLAFMYAVAGIE